MRHTDFDHIIAAMFTRTFQPLLCHFDIFHAMSMPRQMPMSSMMPLPLRRYCWSDTLVAVASR